MDSVWLHLPILVWKWRNYWLHLHIIKEINKKVLWLSIKAPIITNFFYFINSSNDLGVLALNLTSLFVNGCINWSS